MKQKSEKSEKKRRQFKLFALDHFSDEWREVKLVDFEERDFVFKGEHFGNMMDYFDFKVVYVDAEADCENGSGI